MVNWSKLHDYLQISLKSIFNRKLRSWLTMVGIFIGIAAVVALSSLGIGLQHFINAEFEELGVDKIFIMPGGAIFGAGGVDALTHDDVDLISKVRGVETVGGFMFSTARVEWKDELWWNVVMGVSDDPEEQSAVLTSNYAVKFGRPIKKGEKYKAIIGYDYSHSKDFKKPLNIGDKVYINGYKFDVVGALDKVGNKADDRTIIIPVDTARELFGVPTRLDSIIVKTNSGEDPALVAERIERAMRRDRGQDEGEEDFAVQTAQDFLDSLMKIIGIVIGTVLLIAFISLLVGAVGIMNTMYTAVLERTQEIGVMKAIGARNSDVLYLFLFESGMLGLTGGVIGLLMGVGLALLASYLAQTLGGFELLKASFPVYLIIGSLVFSFVVGVLSGILPAKQAAMKNPVDSLRYE